MFKKWGLCPLAALSPTKLRPRPTVLLPIATVRQFIICIYIFLTSTVLAIAHARRAGRHAAAEIPDQLSTVLVGLELTSININYNKSLLLYN